MKKVLLATTILGMTAGFAAAEVAFTGTGTAGIASDAGAAMSTYSSLKLGVAATGESDSGLAFGASASATAGETYTFADDDTFATESGAFGTPSVFISGDFGKVTFANDDMDAYNDDAHTDYDVEYSHSISGIDVGVRTDIESGNSSLKLGYTVAGIGLGATYDQDGSTWGVSASRAFGPVTATLSTDEASVTALKVAYANNGISASAKYDTDEAYEVEAGYAANGLSLGAFTNKAEEWKVTAGYDLGGGLTAEAGINYTEDMFVGAKMAF